MNATRTGERLEEQLGSALSSIFFRSLQEHMWSHMQTRAEAYTCTLHTRRNTYMHVQG